MKTKVFIINAVVIGVLVITAISLPTLMADAITTTDAAPKNTSGLKAVHCEVIGIYKHIWTVEVTGNAPVSWADIFNEWQKECENNPNGAKSLTWVIDTENRSPNFDGDLLPTPAGLAFVRGTDKSEGGIGSFKAAVAYKSLSVRIELTAA